MKIFTLGILALFLLGGGTYYLLTSCTSSQCLFFDWQKIPLINSFERCEELGFPVMESYPRQCRAGDKSFTEALPRQSEEESLSELSQQHELIKVASPQPRELVKSPLTISGEARGNWYFEASFPVMMLDADGQKIGVHHAEAQGEWMTTEFVPFTSTLTFDIPTTATGTLVLLKDNPSGLPEHDDSILIPVRFK